MATECTQVHVVPPPLYSFPSAKLSEPVEGVGPLTEGTHQLTSIALREVIDVQGETIRAIERAERAMNTAENLGEESKQQLAQDRVIIEVVDTTLEQNESMLRRIKRDIIWFRVQLQKDKLFLCLFGIAVVLSVSAIVVTVVQKRKG